MKGSGDYKHSEAWEFKSIELLFTIFVYYETEGEAVKPVHFAGQRSNRQVIVQRGVEGCLRTKRKIATNIRGFFAISEVEERPSAWSRMDASAPKPANARDSHCVHPVDLSA